MSYVIDENNLYIFVYLLKEYLSRYGYASRALDSDFYNALEEIRLYDIRENLFEIANEIHNFLSRILVPKQDLLNWNKSINLTFTRNVDGYIMLNRIVNDIDYFIENNDYEIPFKNYTKLELFYLYFEVNYRINYDIPEFHVKTLNDFISLAEGFNRKTASDWWFRGHSNKNWDLVPTFLRNIDRSTTRIIDFYELDKIYNSYGLKQKYIKVFGYSSLDYSFLSYMQHSTSYSPMIDFTTKFWIAASFALNNKANINDFYNIDSAIICLNNNSKRKIENSISKLKIGVFSDNKTWTSKELITILKGMGVVYKPFADVSSSILRSNDRMKYQHGIFVMYDNFISFPNHSVPIDISSIIFKIVIDKNIKEELYNYIYNNMNEIRQFFLMNPYQFLAE